MKKKNVKRAGMIFRITCPESTAFSFGMMRGFTQDLHFYRPETIAALSE
jgi:hypothetical protein